MLDLQKGQMLVLMTDNRRELKKDDRRVSLWDGMLAF